MSSTIAGDVTALRATLAGSLITPESPDYDEFRRVWNGDKDGHPAVIVCCESDADVAAAITFARDAGFEIAVRGGGHSFAGLSAVDDGLVIDLRRMNSVHVDPSARRVKVGGGALLSDMDVATQKHGLATPAGMISHTGVGGLTLGGGIGWQARKSGLGLDNVVSARVVTADGQVRRAADDENPDLLWAIRGGGGNFGVITEFEFRLHEVGPTVQFALLFYGQDQAVEMFRLGQALLEELPRQFALAMGAITAPDAPFVPEQYQHQPGYVLMLADLGPEDAGGELHAQLVERISRQLPPLFDTVTPTPFVELQQLFDEATRWGLHCYEKGTYIEELTEEVISVLVEQAPLRTSPHSVMLFLRMDGAYCDTADADTAFGGARVPHFAFFITAVCEAPELLAAERDWVRNFWHALQPYSIGTGSYINAMSEVEDDRVRATYGEKYPRLARIKAEYDPQNLFHRNLNILPA
ncbi:FAD-binding oxidoreductase [Pseudonocardia alaniniphila]|uniref:FAD-binding oxidoreductase n=1 Tax=Pseudonocardia alaniniphila TaxID=75291 RepID=A0ABS9T970_9PSEU|nr:FAD-binding oxidoreductase [Pseudonocardia alaniniphila]MCH6165080.1 FAD-binding oxidoreductase [Pseudonocardia alaniniphila]